MDFNKLNKSSWIDPKIFNQFQHYPTVVFVVTHFLKELLIWVLCGAKLNYRVEKSGSYHLPHLVYSMHA